MVALDVLAGMYVGHFLLAFALAGGAAHAAGWQRSRALGTALAAGGFGMIPDVDLAYTLYVVVREGPTNVFPTTQYVWTESWVVHRLLTHSLVVGALGVALAVGVATAFARRTPLQAAVEPRAVGVRGLGAGIAVLALAVIGAGVIGPRTADASLAGVTLALYASAVVAVAALAARRRGLNASTVGGAAAAGLLSHPFGDVFMGTPPAFLYPLSGQTGDAIMLAPDPTVNLLALFGIEVALAWVALAVVASTHHERLLDLVQARAWFGVAYAVAVLVVPPPTLDLAYQFAVGIIATGAVLGTTPVLAEGIPRARPATHRLRLAATALAATTLGLAAYLLAYLTV